MRTIHLYGTLGKEFGRKITLAVETVQEAIDALQANFPAFFGHLRKGHYRVVVGKAQKNGMELDESMLPGFKLGNQDLHITPVVKGSKRGGLPILPQPPQTARGARCKCLTRFALLILVKASGRKSCSGPSMMLF